MPKAGVPAPLSNRKAQQEDDMGYNEIRKASRSELLAHLATLGAEKEYERREIMRELACRVGCCFQ
jgi:hypothetical protein